MNNYEWQTIENLPKDETKILLYDLTKNNYIFCYGKNAEWIIKNSPSYNFSHWILLPTPPTK
jgi:hypothetical protein